MICMLILHGPFGELLADFFGKWAFDLQEDLKGIICESCGFCSPVELVQSLALGEKGLAFPAAIFHILEDLQRLIAIIKGLGEVAATGEGFGEGAEGFALKAPVLDLVSEVKGLGAIFDSLVGNI
jgi:hypothetical protein